MEQILLWFNLIAFTLMIGSFGSTYMIYGRLKTSWLRYYLLYLASYALFLILITYRYFSLVYLPQPIEFLDQLVALLRLGVDLLLLWVVPKFILAILPQEATKRQKQMNLFLSAFVFIVIVIALTTGNWFLNWLNKFLFNLYLGLVTIIGLARVRESPTRRTLGIALPFLYFSSLFYVVLVLLTMLLLFLPHSESGFRNNLVIGGLFCFIWGGGSLVFLTAKVLSQQNPENESISDNFLDQFGITEREKEIITLILQGKSNRTIGEDLFISHRTVEAHIYNIYQKCKIRNKLELSNLVSRMR